MHSRSTHSVNGCGSDTVPGGTTMHTGMLAAAVVTIQQNCSTYVGDTIAERFPSDCVFAKR